MPSRKMLSDIAGWERAVKNLRRNGLITSEFKMSTDDFEDILRAWRYCYKRLQQLEPACKTLLELGQHELADGTPLRDLPEWRALQDALAEQDQSGP